MSNTPNAFSRNRWLKALVAFHYAAAAALVAVGYYGVDDFVDASVLALVVAAWGWLLWRRVAWARKATLVIHALALVALPAGTIAFLITDPPKGPMGGLAFVVIGFWWAVVGPISGLVVWILTRPNVRGLFDQRTPKPQFGLKFVLLALAAAGMFCLGLHRQVERDGQIQVSSALEWTIPIYSREEMGDRSIERFIRASRHGNKDKQWEAAHHIFLAPRPIPLMERLLTHRDAKVREAALEMIASHSGLLSLAHDEKTVELYRRQILALVLERLRDTDAGVRIKAVDALRERWRIAGTAEVVEALMQAAADPSTEVRRQALTALSGSKLDAKTMVPVLKERLTDSAPEVRVLAADAIGQYGHQAHHAADRLIDAVNDANPTVRWRAAIAAVNVGSRDAALVPVLLARLKQPSFAAEAATALSEFGPGAAAAVADLTDLLRSEDHKARAAAVDCLAAIGPGAQRAVPELTRIVSSDADRPIHFAAARALGEIGPPARVAAPQLIALLRRSENPVSVAATALAKIAPDSPEVFDSLRGALRYEPEPNKFSAKVEHGDLVGARNVRFEAARGLAILGPRAAPAVEALRDALRADEFNDMPVRSHAAHALLKIDPNNAEHAAAWRAALDELETLIGQGDYFAIWHGGELGADAAPLVPALVAQLHSANEQPRRSAPAALSKIGAKDEAVIAGLTRLLADPDETARREAARALWHFRTRPRSP